MHYERINNEKNQNGKYRQDDNFTFKEDMHDGDNSGDSEPDDGAHLNYGTYLQMQNHAPAVKKKDKGRSKSHGRNKSKSKYHDFSDEEEHANANDISFPELQKTKTSKKEN